MVLGAHHTPLTEFWIVNGTKKWITNGTWAHYFTVGCKTEDGFTVILVERSEGVETKAIKTSYVRLYPTSISSTAKYYISPLLLELLL